MIEKIIHYIWIGDSPLSEEMQKCIKSWHKIMPDWKIMRWDNESIKNIDSIWLKETLFEKKYAFASDFIRMFVIYHYGGIYLDTDVIVYKSFEPLIKNMGFIGRESCIHIKDYLKTCSDLTSYCFGAEKGNPFIKKCLDFYENRHFILSKNAELPFQFRYSVNNLSYIMCEIAKTMGYKDNLLAPSFQKLSYITIYPDTFFSNPQFTNETYAKHLSIGSWRENTEEKIIYTLRYKISWRIKFLIERILKMFNYMMIKIN